MARVLHITRGAPALSLPADEAVTETFGILARKKGGKTYLAQLMAEQFLDVGAQVVALDPVSKWWALRVKGRGPGREIYVFGGNKGDVTLAPDSGKAVAKLVVEKRISVVLDLTFMRKAQRHRFLADFGEEFLHLKQKEESPTPVHVFVEEAQTVLPQQQRHGGPDEQRMLGAWEDVARLGRNAGIGITMISQRPQSVNKEALSQVECLFALGVNEVAGRQVIEKWVQEKGADRELVGELPGLATGEAIVWSPSWMRFFGRVVIREKETFDASASPKLGRRRKVGKLTKVDMAELRAAMKATGSEAVGRDDPKLLQRRIVELERELALARKVKPVEITKVPLSVVKPAEPKKISVLKAAQLRQLERLVVRVEKARASTVDIENALGDRLLETRDAIDAARRAAAAPKPAPAPALAGVTLEDGTKLPLRVQPRLQVRQLKNPIPVRRNDVIHGVVATLTAATRRTIAAKSVTLEGDVAPTAPQLRLVTALAQSPNGATKEKLSVLLGHKRSYRDLLLRQTKAMGLIDREGDRFVATPAGVAALGDDFQPLPTGPALREHWLRELPGGEKAIFAIVTQAYPNAVEIDALDEETGFKRSYRDLCIRQLRAREIIEKEGRTIRASKELFS